jgi:hypothetical protein
VRKDTRSKITETVKRLREVDRQPKRLTYFTSVQVPKIDILEDTLGEELGVVIRIHDVQYIRAHINDNPATVSAFERDLAPLTAYLAHAGSAPLIATSAHVQNSSVFIFLRQEVDKLDGNLALVDAITDGLCLWALEGTDPDQDIKMSPEDILQKIVTVVPSATKIIDHRLKSRLEALASKSYPGGRKVRWHKKEDGFVLPYQTRQQLEEDNRKDESLRLQVLRGLEVRVRDTANGDLNEEHVAIAAKVTMRALQLSFEQQGLEFAHYVSNGDVTDYPYMADAVRQSLADFEVSGPSSTTIASTTLAVARHCIYHSTEVEREFLGRLARTYALLFTLSNEPRLVEYFQQMASHFYLYVGTDMIVKAMSERYLDTSNQMFRNILRMAHNAGAKLVLAEPVLDEVISHLRASDAEFRNYIAPVEHRLTPEHFREVPKILVRAYLYNKARPDGPDSWPAFVQQFCNYSTLHKTAVKQDLLRYLQATFAMEYRTRAQIQSLTKPEQVDAIKERLIPHKQNEGLAENDALIACAVYGHRTRTGEISTSSEFGFKTWWLTNESSILRHTFELKRENHGARYVMRPDFLLNFLAFAPSMIHVRQTFANVFPSALGLELSRRMDEEAFHKIMAEMKEAEQYEEGRRVAMMAECVDKLKGDFARRYVVESSDDFVRI